MTITLDTVVSGLTANSYVTLENADTYVETYILSETVRSSWDELPDDDKKRLLIHATRMIDENFQFQGWKAIYNQRLLWPRYSAWLYEMNLSVASVPELIQHATVEMAVHLMNRSEDSEVSDISAFKKISVGSIAVEFNAGATSATSLIPDNVIGILEPLGWFETSEGNIIHEVRLERS